MQQLDLLNPRKRKAWRPKASEFALHCAIADTLRVSLTPGWIAFHVPNGGWRTPAEAGKFKRMLVKPGVSDFLLVAPRGAMLHALEIKRQGETPTEEQKAFLEAVWAAGGKGRWVDSYEAAIEALKAWGAVRVKL